MYREYQYVIHSNTETIKHGRETKGQNIKKIESSVKVCHSFYSVEWKLWNWKFYKISFAGMLDESIYYL